MNRDIDPLLLAVRSYQKLQGKTFMITLETGVKIKVTFNKNRFFHLIGFHYLTDISQIRFNQNKKNRIYNNIEKGILTYDIIRSSDHFTPEIEDRVLNFQHIDKLLSEDVIVNFDKSKFKYKSDLKSEFILFKDVGGINIHLCLAMDGDFYPESFFARHDSDYIEGQVKLKIVSVKEVTNQNKKKDKLKKQKDVV